MIKIKRKTRAFMLIELLVVLIILGICAGALQLSFRTTRLTAAQEARRLMQWLYSLTLRSARTGQSFAIKGDFSQGIDIFWKRTKNEEIKESLSPPNGGSFQLLFTSITANTRVHYSAQWGSFTPGMTIEVKTADGSVHYVVASGQGRLRMSNEKPDSFDE